MLRNKNGVVWFVALPTVCQATLGAVALMYTIGHVNNIQEARNIRNARVIACKVANKGAEFCNEKYNFTPKSASVENKSGGKLRAKLLSMQK